MHDEDSDRAKASQRLREVLGEIAREGSEPPPPKKKDFDMGRFGVAWLILAVLTAVFGAYPLPIDVGTRAMFLCFSVVLAFIGAYYLDRSTRDQRLGKPENQEPGSTDTPKAGIRRIK